MGNTVGTFLTIVWDLDGVLCTDEKGNYTACKPIIENIQLCNQLFERGHTCFVETARGALTVEPTKMHELWQMTADQLRAWKVKFSGLRVGVKFPGDIYVDDRFQTLTQLRKLL